MNSLGATFVLVEWHDAHASSQWMNVSEIDKDPYIVQTVGWLLPNAKPDHVVIAQSVSCDEYVDGVLSIPVGMVQKTVLLGHPTPPHTD
jgi:hypothetical protein